MTLPSEGINPWRATGLPNGTTPAPKPQHANLPDAAKIAPNDVPDGDSANGLAADGGKEFKAFGDDGFTFWDLVDVVNPLQHIPVVSTLYRDLTDDTLDPAPRVMGDTLYMGPIGLVASVANVMVEHNTGKDVGSHVMAYFRDESEPLSAPTATANAGPAAAGTDGDGQAGPVDPVTAWAAEQTAYYRAGGDPVSQWAQAQTAYYRAGATQTADAKASGRNAPATSGAADPVAQWAQAQNAYYRNGAAARPTQIAEAAPPAAAGTDGMDVSAWAAEQVAYYQAAPDAPQAQGATAAERAGAMDVAQWAAEQTAYYQGGDAPVSADDPVAAWAQRQTAYYRAGTEDRSRPAASPADTQVAQAGPAETPNVDVSTWARDQLAWVMGDRAQEMAALPLAGTTDRQDARTRSNDGGDNQASGAVAAGGGWFQDNMIQGWTRHQAAQRLAEPGYRPDLAVSAGGR